MALKKKIKISFGHKLQYRCLIFRVKSLIKLSLPTVSWNRILSDPNPNLKIYHLSSQERKTMSWQNKKDMFVLIFNANFPAFPGPGSSAGHLPPGRKWETWLFSKQPSPIWVIIPGIWKKEKMAKQTYAWRLRCGSVVEHILSMHKTLWSTS